ncbi:hypothetical protein B0J11DRAFT_96843 [Dendryphion nanum]|uniref:Uncharacterized protein n=1 Tax=Dendryphion nanum TaxID=256645 RepID=A0A9P9IDT0_9PLEO|nr:hypothetical protein B0J11DRAFT_96843 [Dendryphion nanum]
MGAEGACARLYIREGCNLLPGASLPAELLAHLSHNHHSRTDSFILRNPLLPTLNFLAPFYSSDLSAALANLQCSVRLVTETAPSSATVAVAQAKTATTAKRDSKFAMSAKEPEPSTPIPERTRSRHCLEPRHVHLRPQMEFLLSRPKTGHQEIRTSQGQDTPKYVYCIPLVPFCVLALLSKLYAQVSMAILL